MSRAEGEVSRAIVARATRISQRWLGFFPVRVWQRFSRRNGLLLAAGTSDQAVFAVFAALYVAFAMAGLWLGSSREAVDRLLHLVNDYLPGLIKFDDGPGLVEAGRVFQVTSDSAAVLGATGVLAVIAMVWTAVGWVTFLRSAVRDILGLPPTDANFALVKGWDFVAAVCFALLLAVGSALSAVGTSALSLAFDVLGVAHGSVWSDVAGRVLSIAVAFAIDVIVLVTLYRFLAATDVPLRRVLPGSLLGGAGLVILQLLAGWLVGRAPANPLVTTFALLLGLLLWFRLAMIVILLGAAWVAETADSNDIAIVTESEHDRQVADARTLVTAARLRLRDARLARRDTGWFGRATAIRAVNRARAELAAAEVRLAEAVATRQEWRDAQRRWWRIHHGYDD